MTVDTAGPRVQGRIEISSGAGGIIRTLVSWGLTLREKGRHLQPALFTCEVLRRQFNCAACAATCPHPEPTRMDRASAHWRNPPAATRFGPAGLPAPTLYDRQNHRAYAGNLA